MVAKRTQRFYPAIHVHPDQITWLNLEDGDILNVSRASGLEPGHVKIDGVSVKAAKTVRPGDRIEVRTPGGLPILEVAALGDRRGPASVARALYVDHTPPPPPKEVDVPVVTRDRGAGRPSKRELRQLRRLRGE